jgi:hypothetical protein
MPSICAFCGEESKLCESHVLPAFVYRWLRNRSSSGHIRNTDQPNRRVQDGLKLEWLCERCEARFNKFETEFATKAFHAWTKTKQPILYDAWMQKFCVSISWRVLKYAFGRNPNAQYSINERRFIEAAEQRWRAFLLDETKELGRFQQHLLVFDLVADTTILNLPSNFNRFMSGAVTLDIIGSSKSLMTYAKLGPFTIFGMIHKGGQVWRGTKIKPKKGMFPEKKVVLPSGLIDLFNEKALLSENAFAELSDTQAEKIDRHIIENLDGFLASDQFRAIEADYRMFGEAAVVRKRSSSR